MTEPKRILILTADAGFGHRSAANAIAIALKELYGDACHVDVVNPLDDERTPAFLRDAQFDLDRLVNESPNLIQFGLEASDASVPSAMLESGLILVLFEVMRDLIKQYRPHAVATTYPLFQAPLDAIRVITSKHFSILTVITDLATVHRLWFNEKVDYCLVSSEVVRGLALKYGLKPERIIFSGIPVNPILSKHIGSKTELRNKLMWRNDLTTILVVGSRRVRNLKDALRALNHSGLFMQLILVAGGDDDLMEFYNTTEWHVPVHRYHFVDNLAEMMHASDCVISKAGGLIVTESLACRLPILLVDVNPYQEAGNAEFVVDGHAGALAENPVDLMETLFHWLENDRRLLYQVSQNAERLGHAKAAYDVAQVIWQAAETGLPARTRGLRRSLERSKLLEIIKLENPFFKE